MSLCYVAYMLDITALIILSVYLKENVVFFSTCILTMATRVQRHRQSWESRKQCYSGRNKCDKLFISLKYTWQHTKYFQKLR